MPLSVCLQDTRRRWDDGQLVTCRATSRAVAASARLSSRRAGRRASISIRATPPAKAGCHLQEKHSIEIIAFNSLKLRLERAEIQPHLDAFFKRVREADVLLVRRGAGVEGELFAKRVAALAGQLNRDGQKWRMVFRSRRAVDRASATAAVCTAARSGSS